MDNTDQKHLHQIHDQGVFLWVHIIGLIQA